MTAITFDTLKYSNRLKAVGVPDKQAEAMAEMQADVFDKNLGELATKQDLRELELRFDTKLEKEIGPVRTELAVVKWMLGVQMAGVIALILKTFFPH